MNNNSLCMDESMDRSPDHERWGHINQVNVSVKRLLCHADELEKQQRLVDATIIREHAYLIDEGLGALLEEPTE